MQQKTSQQKNSLKDEKIKSSSIESLITDNIETWTSAVKKKSATGRGSNKKIELYGIKKLRELILELAVRGKLVAQDANDEPASVLLERIATEKAQLVADNKIKNQKTLPAITDKEMPFNLPGGWAFERLGNLTSRLGSGSTPRGGKNAYVDKGVIFLRSQNVWNDGLKLDDTAYISDETHHKMENTRVFPNDVLLNITGASLGRSTIFPKALVTANVSQHVTVIRLIHPSICQYLHLAIMSPLVQELAWGRQVGMAIEGLSKKVLEQFEFPVPPLEEQHRIVAKVDELMLLCDLFEQKTESSIDAHKTLVEVLLTTLTDSKNSDELNKNWARVSEFFDILFTTEHSIDQLKQTILQLAVMGKLVAQNENDEPASKLLERIAAEKETLIKDKKIKKQKALPPITDEEKPFSVPSGWEWCRIYDASLFTEYGTSEKAFEGNDGVPVLKMGDIQSGKVYHGGQKVVPSTIKDLPNLYLKYGDILYNRTNSAELVGKTGMFEGDDDIFTFASYLIRIRCDFEKVAPQYLTLSMQTPLFKKTQIDPHVKQQCGQANVNGTIMKSMLISIPSLSEQYRIVNKVEELMTLCDQLKTRLNESQQSQLHLADALIEQAVN
ncbi:restriction modification system DNA specificity domain protein [Psychromonas ingrahamii 37]|uniref:Restriction modification system DNA specificity domain protein n=1 Tax=Psychromonas ingrahamii (strain DSM 17664 / CCUG 51855 / 37) TaxID=357804 RepID=A1SW07_PSYIN|nr:restriction endonuclease subunit S [Psychromonas ingrahamii]ABM03672.1 restriction modification system DNA specificity domain protein [Psychromonas ingrahamii 37]